MDEAILITSSLLFGAGAGALLTYAHDRSLLRLYGNMVHDFSRMLRRDEGPSEPPASAMCVPEWSSSADQIGKRAS